jgi:predicted unusual protein kinase regulating ubiquinone biosynthesis (AarF/ABC1/UbiB family)
VNAEHSYHSTSLFNVGYDAEGIIEYYDKRPWEVGLRLNMLGLPLLGWYLGLLTDNMLKMNELESVQRKRGEELRNHLVRSRSVALIKSGQALSLRPDLLKSKIWAEELGKLVDEVGSFPDIDAMSIMREELSDLLPRLKNVKRNDATTKKSTERKGRTTRLQRLVESDPILSLFEFYNDFRVVASASIGQVYKARLKRGPALEAILGKSEAAKWGGKTVAIKIQRPDVAASAALDMYLIRRTAMWLSKVRGGDVVAIADTFGMQLFGELDYVRESKNCERFRELYGAWEDVVVPSACTTLTRKKVLILEWVEGTKGPWMGSDGIEMVRIGLRCSTDQLLRTGLFHADPHKGNLLRTPKGHLAIIDYGMMADIPESDRYGLIGLVLGLKNKDIALATENLLALGFLEDTTQVEVLVPRLRKAIKNATGGTNKASDLSFSQLQVELDDISRDNLLKFKIPPYITIIIRSLTILEGFALSVDPNFRLIRGAYPYILKILLSPEGQEQTPKALNKLLVRILTVNGEKKEVEWGRLRQLLRLAEKASKYYDPSKDTDDDKGSVSRKTIDLFIKFLTSKTGLFLKEPLVHELAEAIDGMASIGERNVLSLSRGIIRPLPGGNGPINKKRMVEIRALIEVLQSALSVNNDVSKNKGSDRMELVTGLTQELLLLLNDKSRRELVEPILEELTSVIQMVTVEVLEIRSSRAIRDVLGLVEARS